MEALGNFDVYGNKIEYNFLVAADGISEDKSLTAAKLLVSDEDLLSACGIIIYDKNGATFDRCFENPFVYGFYVETPHYYCYNEKIAVTQKYHEIEAATGHFDEKAMHDELRQYHERVWSLQNKALHHFLDKKLAMNEFAEQYIAWVSGDDFNFKPPTIEQTVTLKELLTIPMFWPFDCKERYKLTVHVGQNMVCRREGAT